jgi:hypothetical protein
MSLLLAAPLEELRRRIIRVRLRFEAAPPDGAGLGQLLEKELSGRQWQAVFLDPDRAALDALRERTDLDQIEETALTLEEMYTALLARFHTAVPPTASGNGRTGRHEPAATVQVEEGGRP